MGAAEAYQTGGWPLVLIVVVVGIIAYLLQDNRGLRKRIDEMVDAELDELREAKKRDAEELRDRRRREQEVTR